MIPPRRRMHRKRVNISTVLAGQRLGIKEVDDGIWIVSFMNYDLGFVDLKKNWTKKIIRHLGDEELNYILTRRDFNKYTWGRWEGTFGEHQFPYEWESCDWDAWHRGPKPRFWMYVKHGACHWLVDFALRLAMLTLPSKEWRIITSDAHSTVWDGQTQLFEFN